MRSKILSCVLVIGFVLTSCDSKSVFDEYQSVPNKWHKDDIKRFNFNPIDSIKSYNLFINLRNNNNYKFNNLFLIIDMNYPNGKTERDTLEYKMAKPNGELLGTGFSDLKENKLWYKQNFVFKESGDYIINIQHAMRENGQVNGVENLEGVTDVGFRVEKLNDN